MRASVKREFSPDKVGDEVRDLPRHFFAAFEGCAAALREGAQSHEHVVQTAQAWGLIRHGDEMSYRERLLLQQLLLYVRHHRDYAVFAALPHYELIFSVYERRDRQELWEFFCRGRRLQG